MIIQQNDNTEIHLTFEIVNHFMVRQSTQKPGKISANINCLCYTNMQ